MNKVIILLGPTGVGKSGVSILLAKELKTEIISADSMQIYRHMDIGTAKPSKEDETIVRHHMIDIVDPWESYSTGKYITAVVPIIDKLHRKGKIPIVVGGTGLYIKAMTRGIFSGPPADWTLREELLSIEREERGSLYNYLKELDPDAAGKIASNDTRRVIRALEVCLKSKANISEMQKKLTRPLPYDFIKIGLTRDRKELYRIIEKRVDEIIRAGLIDEVKMVINLITEYTRIQDARCRMQDKKNHESCIMYRTSFPLPSMQAIGYKEIATYLHGDITLEEGIRFIKRGTKRYAKRQFTWFRKEEGIYWIDITGIYDTHEAFMRVYNILKSVFKLSGL